MQLQAFQPWERRDENDNIIRPGSYGKKSVLANAQNTGILDYIGNNLDVLFEGFNETYSKSEVNEALANKANSADVNEALALKANSADVYTKTQVDSALGGKADKNSVFYRNNSNITSLL